MYEEKEVTFIILVHEPIETEYNMMPKYWDTLLPHQIPIQEWFVTTLFL